MKRSHVLPLMPCLLVLALSMSACGGAGGGGEILDFIADKVPDVFPDFPGSSEPTPPAKCVALPRNPPVPEIPDFSVQDIAVATRDPFTGQPVILYNPQVSDLAGPSVSQFFVAHEYGHIYMHIPTGQGGLRAEREADEYAAEALLKTGQGNVLEVAIQYFRFTNHPGDANHDPHFRRAARLTDCTDRILRGEPYRYVCD